MMRSTVISFLSITISHLLCLLLFVGMLILPQNAGAKKFAGDFMAMGGGARALGMGGAFAAVANDASTVFWNPSGISGFTKRQALFMHSERFGQLVNYNFASFVMPARILSSEKEAAFGFALIHLGVDDIAITNHLNWEERNGIPGFQPNDGDILNYDMSSIPKENNNDLALLSSFALKTGYGRVGGALKLLYSNAVAGYSSTGIGLDLGFLYKDLFPSFDIGVKLQDITGTYISWSSGTNEFIAPSIKLGTAYTLSSHSLNGSLLIAFDADVFFENRQNASQLWIGRTSADLHFGGEIRFQERVMVRGGVDSGNPTAGAGVRFGFLGFDYAYLHHDDFEATHRVSALAEF
ncbi:MAG: PorV/PorQ family protein [Candidatus Latescibacteria bacterium]|nr:PorV/PorQ family protein [Candidatus Latescibacterota bacterium]NIM21365.1 PorV/PorQ family protein [Candidatus Latescibacterota bacterium]NIM65546.1 PorV/PorQ family protein [Candidatus Latescibacterota bacterium]NIO01926.1 PorV/PorQ family protein [Candidatus Latescibacterota bacterium]NIO28739.1 PorV/PorQ family protein [Candidatus Latescibacterota bacterium]